MNTELLAQLYQSYTGEAPTSIEPLPGAGSNRKYFRLKGKESLIGVYGTSTEENRAFIYMARHFSQKVCLYPVYLPNLPTSRSTCKMTWEIPRCSNLLNKEEKAVTSVMKKQIY